MLRSDLCEYSHANIVLKGTITVVGDNNVKIRNEKLTFKNNFLFRLCILKINNTFIDNAEDLDIVMQCIMCYNIVRILLWHQEVLGVILKIK